MPKKIYFDEAGNTGPDLMNIDQPIYVLAANTFSDEEAKDLLSHFNLQQGEAKFKNLKKSNAGQKRIVEFIRKILSDSEKVKLLVIHKKFMLLASIFHHLVEPIYASRNINYTANKRHIGVVNFLWYVMPLAHGENALDELLASFIQLLKSKSKNDIDDFYNKLKLLRSDQEKGFQGFYLDDLLLTEPYILEFLETRSLSDFDPVQTGLFTHAGLWGNSIDGDFQIIHDESNSLKQTLDHFNLYTDQTKDEKVINFNGFIIKLPLDVHSVTLEESSMIPQIQVSDLIAGSAAFLFKQLAKDPDNLTGFSKDLHDTGLPNFVQNIVWPQKQFFPKDFGINELELPNSINAIDQIVSFLYPNK